MLYKSRDEAYRVYREAPNEFFEQYHERWFNEKDLISPEWSWFETKYHYNLVENSIIDILRAWFAEINGKSVLDVGAGTGHWIHFYDRYLDASSITAVDFSSISVHQLRNCYAERQKVDVRQADISVREARYEGKFDIINAIGVMFHLIDDACWTQAIRNMLDYLAPGGIVLVGGEFGQETHELGIMRKHRSLGCWESILEQYGAKIITVKYHDWFKGGVNDGLKNNLLAFTRT